jgi:hypothetical protein
MLFWPVPNFRGGGVWVGRASARPPPTPDRTDCRPAFDVIAELYQSVTASGMQIVLATGTTVPDGPFTLT